MKNLNEADYRVLAETFGFADWRDFMIFVVEQQDKATSRQVNGVRRDAALAEIQRRERVGMVYGSGRV